MSIYNGGVRPRKGRGLSEGTFRKHYHGLKTLHLHIHRKQVYEVHRLVSSVSHHTSSLVCDSLYTIIFVQFNDETKWEGNPCNDPTVQVMVKRCIIHAEMSDDCHYYNY